MLFILFFIFLYGEVISIELLGLKTIVSLWIINIVKIMLVIN